MLLMTTIMTRLATVGVIVVSTLTTIRNDLIVRIAAHDDDHDRDHGPHLLALSKREKTVILRLLRVVDIPLEVAGKMAAKCELTRTAMAPHAHNGLSVSAAA